MALAGLQRRGWIDLHASHDVVPTGRRSVFTGATFLRRHEVSNERSFLNDHTRYFHNVGAFLPRVWQAMSRVSSLRLFERADLRMLRRYAAVHEHYARVLAASHVAFVLAALVRPLLARRRRRGGDDGRLLRRRRALRPAPVAWVAFKSSWRGGCQWRSRRACCRIDVLHDGASRMRHAAGCAAFGFIGLAPLTVALPLVFAPQALAARTISEVVAAALAAVVLLFSLLYLAGGPWVVRSMSLHSFTRAGSRVPPLRLRQWTHELA
jgi:hypothetical protein